MDNSSWSSEAGRTYQAEERDFSRGYVFIVHSTCLGTLGNQVWLEDSVSKANRGV